MNKLIMGVAGLAILAAPLAASAQSYGHERDGGYRGYGRGYGGGGAVAAGVAGLAIGAALANQGDYGYAPGYGYAYAPRCAWRYRPYRTYYGAVAYRRIEICR